MPAPEDREKIEKVIDAFEEAWLAGEKPRIEDFVKDAGEARRDLLIELAFTDLEYRLRGGEARVVEDYASRFPELRTDDDAWRGLIVEEFRQRRRVGQNPTRNEYRERFPDQDKQLDRSYANDQFMAPSNLPTRPHFSAMILPAFAKRYKPQRVVAEGGMGYIARIVDTEFDRPLAMKVLSDRLKGNKELDDRFMREARLTGQLQHPGIPPVQEKGRFEDGTPYFIMKLIKGHSLQKLLRDRAAPQERLGHFVGIFGSICQTVAYAHSRGIIHRDLKPSNIMVGAFGEVQVMDWGLAKILRTGLAISETNDTPASEYSSTMQFLHTPTSVGKHTIAGSVMGTPGYMAPEQARGETDLLDQRCDVFGLGGILCDILTGRPPFEGSTKLSGLQKTILGEIYETFDRLDQSGADHDLIELAKRCLATEMENRPADAKAVADAVAAYQAQVEERLKQSELEQARLITQAENEKIRRRDRRILGGCIAGLLLIGVIAWRWHDRTMADTHIQNALKGAGETTRQVDTALELVNFGHNTLKKGLLVDARKTLDQSQYVAKDALKKKNTAALEKSAASAVEDKFREFDEKYAVADKNARLAQRLVDGFDGRGELKENDYDARQKAVIVFATVGKDIYKAAFSDFGAPIDKGTPAEVAAKLESFPLRDALGLALTDWLLFVHDRPMGKSLFEIADIVDPNPDRSRLRSAVRDGKVDDLVKFAKELQIDPQPPRPGSNPAQFVVLLAEALRGAERSEEALLLLIRAHDEIPNDFWINDMLGVYLLALEPGRRSQAIAQFESAYVLRPHAPFVSVHLADALRAERRFEQAEKVCRRYLVKIDESNPRLRALLADTLIDTGNFDQAEIELGKGLAFQKESGFLNASLAGLRGRQGNHTEAGKLAESVLKKHPGFMHATGPVGFAHLKVAHDKEPGDDAKAHFKEALKAGEYLIGSNPHAAVGYDLASQALIPLGDLDKAERYAARGVANDPKSASMQQTMGRAYFARGDYKRGFLAYQSAAELLAGPLPTFNAPAGELHKNKQYSEAGWLYAEIVKRDPKDPIAWKGLIDALEFTREVADTKEHLGASLDKLTRAQTNRLNALAPIGGGATNAAVGASRPINAQQGVLPQMSPKRNQK